MFETTAAELTDPEAFKATPAHKAWCGAHAALVLVILSKGASPFHSKTGTGTGQAAHDEKYFLSCGRGLSVDDVVSSCQSPVPPFPQRYEYLIATFSPRWCNQGVFRICKRDNLVGPFFVHKLLVPNPLPPSPPPLLGVNHCHANTCMHNRCFVLTTAANTSHTRVGNPGNCRFLHQPSSWPGGSAEGGRKSSECLARIAGFVGLAASPPPPRASCAPTPLSAPFAPFL